MKSDNNLIWIDLEMTGLVPGHHKIIEIATLVTDAQLNILAEGPVLAISVAEQELSKMDHWCVEHHGKSGLTQRVRESCVSTHEAEVQTLAFLTQYVSKGVSPMCGNSICQDRRFLVEEMPALEAFFHYRNLDVSTLKELAKRWYPDVYSAHKKHGAHLAMADIKESIDELKHYRAHLFKG